MHRDSDSHINSYTACARLVASGKRLKQERDDEDRNRDLSHCCFHLGAAAQFAGSSWRTPFDQLPEHPRACLRSGTHAIGGSHHRQGRSEGDTKSDG